MNQNGRVAGHGEREETTATTEVAGTTRLATLERESFRPFEPDGASDLHSPQRRGSRLHGAVPAKLGAANRQVAHKMVEVQKPQTGAKRPFPSLLVVVLVLCGTFLWSGCDDVDVVFNPTTTPRTGTDPTPTPTQTATVTPSPSSTPTVPAEDLCREDGDCEPSFLICLEPGGFAGCGVCQTFPEDECRTDADCVALGERYICSEAGPRLCPCETPVFVCVQGCSDTPDCDVGEVCDDQNRCVPSPCDDDSDCPEQFSCHESQGDGRCGRRACDSDPDCPQGFCVQGRCHAELGTCTAIPA